MERGSSQELTECLYIVNIHGKGGNAHRQVQRIRNFDAVKPIKIVGMFVLTLAIIAPRAAYADWKVYYTGKAQKMFGAAGRGNFATSDECNAYKNSRPGFESSNSYCSGFNAPSKSAGNRQSGAKALGAQDAAATAAIEQKQKLDAMLRQQAEAEQRAFAQDQRTLLDTLEGVSPSGPANNIVLKAIPPGGGLARSQLDCAMHNKPEDGWEKQPKDCSPVARQAPEPPKPTLVPMPPATDPASLAQFLADLGQRISSLRDALATQDHELSVKEREIAQEELKIPDPGKPKGESDALRRARDALEKAKADRARTAAELAQLEKQELAAKSNVEPPAR